MNAQIQKPSAAFVGISLAALMIGGIAFVTGLWNATMRLNEKCYYFRVLMCGLFSAVALQKNTRDLAAFEANRRED